MSQDLKELATCIESLHHLAVEHEKDISQPICEGDDIFYVETISSNNSISYDNLLTAHEILSMQFEQLQDRTKYNEDIIDDQYRSIVKYKALFEDAHERYHKLERKQSTPQSKTISDLETQLKNLKEEYQDIDEDMKILQEIHNEAALKYKLQKDKYQKSKLTINSLKNRLQHQVDQTEALRNQLQKPQDMRKYIINFLKHLYPHDEYQQATNLTNMIIQVYQTKQSLRYLTGTTKLATTTPKTTSMTHNINNAISMLYYFLKHTVNYFQPTDHNGTNVNSKSLNNASYKKNTKRLNYQVSGIPQVLDAYIGASSSIPTIVWGMALAIRFSHYLCFVANSNSNNSNHTYTEHIRISGSRSSHPVQVLDNELFDMDKITYQSQLFYQLRLVYLYGYGKIVRSFIKSNMLFISGWYDNVCQRLDIVLRLQILPPLSKLFNVLITLHK